MSGIKGKYQPSYWELESFYKNIDYAILGSGLVGLNAAIYIKEKDPGANVIVLERGSLPAGASTRNAGFACFGSLTELIDDLQQSPENEVLELVSKRWEGLNRLKERIGVSALRYKSNGAYEIFKPEEADIHKSCRQQMAYFNEKLAPIIKHKEVFISADDRIQSYGFKGVQHLIKNQAEGQIHTGEMMSKLIDIANNKGVRIFNGFTIMDHQSHQNGVTLTAANGWEIQTAKLLVATNGFAKTLLKELPLQAARNQVLITAPIPDLKFKACFHYDRGYFYFRNIDNRILLGGGRNLAGAEETTEAFGTTELIRRALTELLSELILPHQEVEIEHWWSGILGVGDQKKPILQKHDDHTVIAVRMGRMGVAIGSLVGEEGARLLMKL